jgi:HK97 gp10 family phage protein
VGFVRIDVSEVHQLAGDLRQAGETITAKAEAVVAAAGSRVVSFARAIVPVDTGLLKSSIDVDVNGLSFEAGASTEYAEYVELGTSRMSAEPFMGPAFDRVNQSVVDLLALAGSDIL